MQLNAGFPNIYFIFAKIITVYRITTVLKAISGIYSDSETNRLIIII